MNHVKSFAITTVALGALALAGCDEKRTDTTTSTTPASPTYENKAPTVGEGARNEAREAKNEAKGDLNTLGHTAERNIEPTAKGGGPMFQEGSREWARDKMAHVRCDHYKGCGDIAKSKKYDTYESCVTRENADLDKDWKLDDCARIDTPRLDACMAAVNAKKCNAIFNTAPSECATSKVCIDMKK
ncbi:MAG: hypothetical protein NVS3B20_13400 [Polyangiales bacterium]